MKSNNYKQVIITTPSHSDFSIINRKRWLFLSCSLSPSREQFVYTSVWNFYVFTPGQIFRRHFILDRLQQLSLTSLLDVCFVSNPLYWDKPYVLFSFARHFNPYPVLLWYFFLTVKIYLIFIWWASALTVVRLHHHGNNFLLYLKFLNFKGAFYFVLDIVLFLSLRCKIFNCSVPIFFLHLVCRILKIKKQASSQ